ncbi:MAG: YggS family pyridoxal phosphate-dependent enzyme [Pseudoflavonifractor sp.]|nr:YggS family pyridoxal phosphate-dependent enzyme [Pseudoflavonifractor sp.]
MGIIANRIAAIKATLPEGVKLVAVSKFHPVESLMDAYGGGQRIFGESRAQELTAKAAALPADIEWHFIGHLQTNKVRQVVPHVSLIHSVDSDRLLRAIDSEAVREGRRVGVLFQVHVAREETKYGFTPDELLSLASSGALDGLQGAEIRGVMGMASNTDDMERVAADFAEVKTLFDRLREGPMSGNSRFDTISTGMSHDYLLAVANGSTMVRVGTSIFGEREY